MTTFSVDSVKRSKTPLEEVDWREYVADDLQAEPDGLFRFPEYLFPAHVRTNNKFMGAVHQAYEGHYPLVLSPDIASLRDLLCTSTKMHNDCAICS